MRISKVTLDRGWLWSTLLGYAVTRLRHPLQLEMLPRLTDAELTAAVLDAAIGIV